MLVGSSFEVPVAGFSKVSDSPYRLRCYTHQALLDRLQDRVSLYSRTPTDAPGAGNSMTGGQYEVHRSPDLPFWGHQEIRFFQPNFGIIISDYTIEEEFDYEFVYENLSFVQFRIDGASTEPGPGDGTPVTLTRPGFKVSTAPAGHVDRMHYLPTALWRTVTAFFDEAAIKSHILRGDAAAHETLAALARWKAGQGTALPSMTAGMLDAARAVMNCELTGSLRKTFLEAKAVELLCMLIAVIDEELTGQDKLPLTRQERIKLEAAREILDVHFAHPPTLMELGRMVGLNRRKLATGFKCLFRKTVYQYCVEQRMSHARALLRDKAPISQVAEAAGYADQASFSRAFSQYHGHNPKYFLST